MLHTSKLLALKDEYPELDELTYDDLSRDFKSTPCDASPSPVDKEYVEPQAFNFLRKESSLYELITLGETLTKT